MARSAAPVHPPHGLPKGDPKYFLALFSSSSGSGGSVRSERTTVPLLSYERDPPRPRSNRTHKTHQTTYGTHVGSLERSIRGTYRPASLHYGGSNVTEPSVLHDVLSGRFFLRSFRRGITRSAKEIAMSLSVLFQQNWSKKFRNNRTPAASMTICNLRSAEPSEITLVS